ncbi:DEXDc domain containing protein [uncultured Caudovirales phage]|uniref:DEXDc domain containing protein n=1 Tax=uncultured Caudovirales phage TaxID=2100421 RepID=A0A6J5S5C6_9CAUD|nr:DEXDc domain containing protein [uncultured Caudovirales phage]
MKVRIDGRAWMPLEDLPPAARVSIRETLTIQPKQTSEHSKATPPIRLYAEEDGLIGVPRGFFDQNVTGKHDYDVRVAQGGAMGAGVSAKMFQGDTDGKYAEQNTAVAEMIKLLTAKPWGGGILQAPTGTGKTIMGLRIAAELGRRTLIVVNKGFFLRQWTSRIRQVFPQAKIGIVQGPKCQHEGMDFVIGMVHTLSQRDFPDGFYRSFGLVLTDEVHRIGAPTWADVVPQFSAAYRVGLTATPRRKDGAQDVFFHHIGAIAYRLKSEPMIPLIRRVIAPFQPDTIRQYGKEIEPGDQSTSQIVSQMVTDPFYNRTIAIDLSKAIVAGRKVLVVSERLEHLWTLSVLTREVHTRAGHPDFTSSFATGQQYVLDESGERIEIRRKTGLEFKTRPTTDADLDSGEEAQVVYATKQMIEEGFDIPALDTLALVTPVSDVEQIAGRVRRWCFPEADKCFRLCPWRAGKCKGKPDPIVMDVRTPDWPALMNKATRREGFYVSIGAKFKAPKA